jgi:hypothetical protein
MRVFHSSIADRRSSLIDPFCRRGCEAGGGCVGSARGGVFLNISRNGDLGGGAGDWLRLRGVPVG